MNPPMRLETTQEIVELLDSPIVSAALGSAMELGLFWLLAKEPLSASDVAQSLRIPLNRCEIWLQMLSNLGLLEADSGAYCPSEVARAAILDAQTQETWAFHARENRETSLFVQDLALNLGKPMSDWEPRSPTLSDYLDHIQEDPTYATGLTRKLCEIHQPLAEQLADILDLRAVKSLLDLGGGSGVAVVSILATCAATEGVCFVSLFNGSCDVTFPGATGAFVMFSVCFGSRASSAATSTRSPFSVVRKPALSSFFAIAPLSASRTWIFCRSAGTVSIWLEPSASGSTAGI